MFITTRYRGHNIIISYIPQTVNELRMKHNKTMYHRFSHVPCTAPSETRKLIHTFTITLLVYTHLHVLNPFFKELASIYFGVFRRCFLDMPTGKNMKKSQIPLPSCHYPSIQPDSRVLSRQALPSCVLYGCTKLLIWLPV